MVQVKLLTKISALNHHQRLKYADDGIIALTVFLSEPIHKS
jgi:hypothetical protein